MYTSHKIHTHNKCLCILEMIQKANNRIEMARSNLMNYERSEWHSFFRLMHNKEDLRNEFDRMQAVKKRLVGYYQNIFSQLNKKTAVEAAA